jgi:hypothetical protein
VDEQDDAFREPRAKGQFGYFSRQLGIADWSGLRVLDFGGNNGSILSDPACTIAPDRYWCLDVYRDVIEAGRNEHPGAHFVHYDLYSAEYNPAGTNGLPIPDLGAFDVILAYSVFTHTPEAEMRELVGQLRDRLTGDGRLAFTFLDPGFVPPSGWAREDEMPGLSNLRWRLAAAGTPDVPGAPGASGWVTLAGREWGATGDDGSAYITLCTEAYMRGIFPDGRVLPPPPGARHSCCVLRK